MRAFRIARASHQMRILAILLGKRQVPIRTEISSHRLRESGLPVPGWCLTAALSVHTRSQPAPLAFSRSAAAFLGAQARTPAAGTRPQQPFATCSSPIPRQLSHRRETTAHQPRFPAQLFIRPHSLTRPYRAHPQRLRVIHRGSNATRGARIHPQMTVM